MRLSLVGSTGWLGSTYSSRLPLPLVSSTSAVQPCDLAASPVSSNIFVLTQPTTGPPPLVHTVSLASYANCRWWVWKHVSTNVYFIVFGSRNVRARFVRSIGKSCAEGWLDPFLQKAGLSGPRTAAANHTRPFRSNMPL